jgi:hypothetical protein
MDRVDELLKKSWEGEVLGRSFFGGLAESFPDDRRMWNLLEALEATMESLIVPVAREHGLAVDAARLETSGNDYAQGAGAGGREDLFKGTLDVVSEYLQIYQELTAILPEDEAWLGHELIAHENALAYYMERALSGQDGGEDQVLDFLTRHGAEIPVRA